MVLSVGVVRQSSSSFSWMNHKRRSFQIFDNTFLNNSCILFFYFYIIRDGFCGCKMLNSLLKPAMIALPLHFHKLLYDTLYCHPDAFIFVANIALQLFYLQLRLLRNYSIFKRLRWRLLRKHFSNFECNRASAIQLRLRIGITLFQSTVIKV